jgi:UDP-GlcNAc3NAcA epimerase
MKVVTIVGARPQLIKAVAVSRLLRQRGIREDLVHTGQHFDRNMSAVFFRELGIPKPYVNLGIHSLGHGAMTGRMLEKIERILARRKPDAVIVYGDTNSTLAGALAARKMHIPLAHIEAGLRSHNMQMPEEVNRIVTDRISDFLFCPTRTAVQNLKREGFDKFDCKVIHSGDVMYDTALHFLKLAQRRSSILESLSLDAYVVCSLHREENTMDRRTLASAIRALNRIHRDIEVVMPVHPRTRQAMRRWKIKMNFRAIDPVGYLDMLMLTRHAQMVLTDSGGLQKEAYFFKKPCVTLREETEWQELVDHGYNLTVGSDTRRIVEGFAKMRRRAKKLSFRHAFYGNGHAAEKIVSSLVHSL